MKHFGLLIFVGCALAENGYNYPQTAPLFQPAAQNLETSNFQQPPIVPSISVGLQAPTLPNFNTLPSSDETKPVKSSFVPPLPLEIQNLQKTYIPPAPTNTYIPPATQVNIAAPQNTYVPPATQVNIAAPQNTYVPPAPQNTYIPPEPQVNIAAPQNTYVPPEPQVNIAAPQNTYIPPEPQVNIAAPQNTYVPPQNTLSTPEHQTNFVNTETTFVPPQTTFLSNFVAPQNSYSSPASGQQNFVAPQNSYSSPASGQQNVVVPQNINQQPINNFAPNFNQQTFTSQQSNNNNFAPNFNSQQSNNALTNTKQSTPIFEENMDINHQNPYTDSLARFIPHYRIPERNPNAPPAPTHEEQQQNHKENIMNLKFISANLNYNLFNYTTTTPRPRSTIEPLTAPTDQLFNYEPMNVQGQTAASSGPMTVNLDYQAATIPNVRPAGSSTGPLNKYLPTVGDSYKPEPRPQRYQVFAPVKSRELFFSH